jgi:(2Fe-2S) ferredoxin
MPRPRRHVLVCTNTRPAENPRSSCGGQGLFDELRAAVAQGGLGAEVMVSRTFCLKHCSKGPVVVIHPDDVWYSQVTSADVTEICESHLTNGVPVDRLLMPDIPWE